MGCYDGRAGAQDAAKQLASAVAALDVGSVAFEGKDSGAANEQLKEVFKALDPVKPAVESGELTLEKDTATVPLNYSWKIGSGEWKYTTSAAAEEVRRQMADRLEPGHAGARAGRGRSPRHLVPVPAAGGDPGRR